MPKQTIEIDVPEGYEQIPVYCPPATAISEDEIAVTVYFKKKEPEFIEVREYFAMCGKALTVGVTIIGCPKHSQPEEIEKYGNFVRWIDKEPRKVEI